MSAHHMSSTQAMRFATCDGSPPADFDPTLIDRSDQKLEQCNDPFKVCGAVPITVEVVALPAATSSPRSSQGTRFSLGGFRVSRLYPLVSGRARPRSLSPLCGRFDPNAARHRVLRRPGLGPTECAAAGALDVGARDPCRPQRLSISAILHVVGRALLFSEKLKKRCVFGARGGLSLTASG
jgi:hypothetical protein